MRTKIKKILANHPRAYEAMYRTLYLRTRSATAHESDNVRDAAEVFGEIYADNYWGDEYSKSGPGSNLAATADLVRTLPALLARLGCKSLLDAPCGDFAWMRHIELGTSSYVGGDIVQALVADLQRTYGQPGRAFQTLDIIKDELPPCDVWLCRDCLIHLPNTDVERVLRNFVSSGIPYLATTQYEFVRQNIDIPMGQFRRINLRKAPFGLPAPIDFTYDYYFPFPARRLSVWSSDQVRQAGYG